MDLETHLLETLRGREGGGGLTHGELREKCGPAWRRELARRFGQEGEEAGLAAVKDFVHQLWSEGRVQIEPPAGDGKAVRIWPREETGEEGENRGKGETMRLPGVGAGADGIGPGQRIVEIYLRLSREGRSPYVFLSRLQEETGMPLEVLHRFLREEQGAGRAVLSTGDWSAASEAERAAVLRADGRQYVKVRLVR